MGLLIGACTQTLACNADPMLCPSHISPLQAADAQVFNFARDPAECCDPAGGAFWTRMVQLDEPVRHQGRNRKIQHDRLVQLLVEQLAKNCPCKGLLWIGIGVHELKHGRPWYRDPAAIDPAEYGSRSWVKEAEDKCRFQRHLPLIEKSRLPHGQILFFVAAIIV